MSQSNLTLPTRTEAEARAERAKHTRSEKQEISAAYRALQEQHELAEDIRRHEGNREANASLSYPEAVRRCSRAISTLKRYGEPMPAWLASNWGYYRVIGWHRDFALPAIAKAEGQDEKDREIRERLRDEIRNQGTC